MKKMYNWISAGKFIAALLFCIYSSFTNVCQAQLLQWNTFGNLGTETTEPSVFNDPNIAGPVNLTLGTVTPAANGNRFGGSGWFDVGNTAGGNTLTEAVSGNDYIQFVVTPNGGFSFTPTSLVFTWDRSATGPSSVTLRSSADGFAADLGTVTGMVSGGAATTTPRTITISSLTNIATATTFRLYGYAASAAAGTGGFDNSTSVVDVQLNGSTAAITVPILTAGSMSAAFGNVCINSTAGPQSFSLTGNNLDGSPLNINALPGYSYCLTSGGTYLTSLPISYTAPTLNPTTIFVKFNPTAAISYSGNIPVNGGGTSTTTAVVGAGINSPPTTTSGSAGSIGSTSATVAGTVSSPGCGTLTSYGIEYSTSVGFSNGSGTPVSSTNLVGINFTSSLTGLSLSTVYYYHSYATNSNGITAYGAQGTFTTTIDIPNATAATSVANHSFDANWDPVTGATGYRLDVATTNTFYAASTTSVVEWNFPGNPDDNIADGGIASNLAKTLNLFGCLAAVSYVPTSGSTTSAASTASASGGWASGSGNDYWEVSMVTFGYYNLTISSAQRSSNTGPKDFKLQYKIGAGGTYTDVPGGTISVGNDWTTGVLSSVALPAVCENKISVFLRWIMTSNTGVNLASVGTGGTSAIDNIAVIGNAGTYVSGYNNLSVSGITQPVSGLTANTTYYYRVRAIGASSTSANSNVISVTTTCTPSAINACPSDIVQCDNNIATWTDPTATGDPAATVICSPLSGSTFSLGTTPVTCTASNGCGSPSSCSFNVTINESPAFTACPGTQNANTSGACTAVVSYTTTSSGSPAPTLTYNFSGATSGNGNGDGSGSTFNVGTTVVTVTSTNSCAQPATCTFNIVVTDAESPVITCPPTANILTDLGQCSSSAIIGTATATDNCAGVVISGPFPAGPYSLGATTVTWFATDANGNSSQCNQIINVADAEPPVITCPPTANIFTDLGQCSSSALIGTATATDNCAGVVISGPFPAGPYALGATTVTWFATDANGNSAQCNQIINVADAEPPVITCPPTANILTDLGQCSSSALIGMATATDNCAGVVISGPFPAGPYALGATTVTWFATDANGNSSQCNQIINVADAEPPVITCPPTANILTDLGQCSSSALIGTATATDNCAGVVISGPFPAGPYAVGATTVTWFATDANGNSAQCNQIINVADAENPSITCPAPETIINDLGACTGTRIPCPPNCTGLFVNDNCGILSTLTNHPSPTYSEGITAVIYTVTDIHGNTNTCAQNITVVVNHATAASGISTNAIYNQICYPGALTLTAIGGSLGTAGGQWVWYDGGCGSGVTVGTGASITINPSLGLHSYFVRAEEACGNTTCQSVAINVINAPPSNTIHYTASIADGCVGAPAAVFIVNTVASCTFYNWTSSQAGVRFNGNPSPYQTTVPSVNVTFVSIPAAGSSGWSICVFGGNACGNTNTICTWVRATLSSPATITGSVIGCSGSSLNPYSSSAIAGAASYQWSATGGIVITGNGSQAVTVAFPGGFVSGTLSVHGQTACGFDGPNRNMTITANPVIPGIISGPSYPCPNASSSYSIAAVPGAANYTWTTSVPGAVVVGTSASCSISFPATIPGGSTVSVVANSSCPTTGPVRSKGIATGLPGIPLAINGPASGQCGQTGVSYSITPVASATGYNWSSTCGTIQGPNNLSGITIDWANNMTSCTLSVYSSNTCGNSLPRTLAVTGAPATPAAISGNAAPCANTPEVYSTSAAGATSYNWVVPAGSLILGAANGPSINLLWGATSGNITVTASNACGTSGIRSLPCVISCRQSQVIGSVAGMNAEVYPNPASEKATVKFNSAVAAKYHLNMTDVLGRSVLSTDDNAAEGINMIELDLSNFAKGVYMLSIMSGDNAEQISVVVE